MLDFKCAFSHCLMQSAFACSQAQPVARRSGPDISCQSELGHIQCAELMQKLKAAALPVFNVTDDLLSMPHSTSVKIQYGGLMGMHAQISPNEPAIEDVHGLVVKAIAHFGGIEQIPCERYTTWMTEHKIRRKR